MGDNDIVPLRLTSRLHYKNLHRGLTALLYRHDPIGLAAAGCPKDEYEPEVSTIIPRLKNATTVEDVRRIVHEEFLHWFDGEGTAGPESAYSGIAQDILGNFHGTVVGSERKRLISPTIEITCVKESLRRARAPTASDGEILTVSLEVLRCRSLGP